MAKKAVSPSDAALERVRAVCFGFPGAEEKLSHGAPSFHVRGKMYVNFVDDHHGDGRLAIWCKATPEEQKRLVAMDPARYFVPPYVGVKGWVGAVLNHPKTVAKQPVRPPPKTPPRPTTDADAARAALETLMKICAALPESECERDTCDAADAGERNGFDEELQQHLAGRRADCQSDADLAGSLGHRDEHDVHDADASHEQ